MSEKNLTVVEQKEVEFYSDQITAVRTEDGKVYIPVRPICDLLGVNWAGQRQRIQRDPILSEIITVVGVTHSTAGATNTQTNQMLALPLDFLNGWLFGINANRVKSEIRDSLLRYQRECYLVLADAFGRNIVTSRPDSELMNSDAPAALAYRNAMELANIARQQYYFEKRLATAESSINDAVARIGAIEAQLGDAGRFVTLEQAQRISEAVKVVAFELGSQTGRNEYQGVYGEMHRRYAVPSYRELPAAKFDDCIAWLIQWYQSLSDSDQVPF